MSDGRSVPVNPRWGPLPDSLKEKRVKPATLGRGNTMHDRAFSAERKSESYASHQSSSRGFRR